KSIEVRTTDTGIGIDADKMETIFNAFEQGQSSITRRFGGLGLGLAISKAMVVAHGGTIRAASRGKGLGSTFVVALDTVPTPVMPQPDGAKKIEVKEEVQGTLALKPKRHVLV